MADAAQPAFSPATFDFVLADVPCTNSGVFRRRPDAPWRFSEKRLKETVHLQKQILNALARLVKPGGLLVYSTCSIDSAEDDDQIRAFLGEHPDFELECSKLLLPAADCDGAYAAHLRKKN